MRFITAAASAISQGVLIVVACLAVFALAEVGVRTYAALFMDSKSFFREDRFISPWFTTYDYPPPRFDADGNAFFRHRAEPVPREKPPGLVRVIAVGGSTTANERPYTIGGVDYAGTLERLLNENSKGPRYEVLNAGADAFSTAHSLVNIYFRLLEFSPDVIVLMHNMNDVSVNYFADGATSDYANKYLHEFYLNPALRAGASIMGLLNQSRLIAATRVSRATTRGAVDIRKPIATGLRYFARNLTMISDLCKANGVTLVLLSQPNSLSGSFRFYNLDDFRTYNRKIEEVSRETGAIFVDMFERLGHAPELFLDQVHFTPLGIRKFSEILFEALRDRI